MATAETPRERKSTLRADMTWVYNQLERDRPTRAPSMGAKALLKWAKDHTGEFLSLYIVRMVSPAAKEPAASDGSGGDGSAAVTLDLINRLLDGGIAPDGLPPESPLAPNHEPPLAPPATPGRGQQPDAPAGDVGDVPG